MVQETIQRLEYILIVIVGLCLTTICLSPNVRGGTVSSSDCLECHEEMQESLEMTSHRLVLTEEESVVEISCLSCHSGGELHVEDPSTENIGNPSGMSLSDARDACSDCHQPHVGLDNYGYDVHSELQLKCSSCHKVHGGNQELLLSSKAEFCLKCHDAVSASFTRRSQHPLNQQNITCLSCHRFTKRRDQAITRDIERMCQNCHPEESGPFPYEHEAVNAYAVEGSGCLACHNPHGSENDHLLKQKGKELCIQCHVTPAGHESLSSLHGNIRSIENCYACHSDIHGSFVSRKLLDPMLSTRLASPQDCAECHDLTD